MKKPRSDATGKKEQSRILSLKFLFSFLVFSRYTYPTLRGHLLCARLGRIAVLSGPSKRRVLDRRQRIALASAAGSRDLLADALVHDLEMRIVQESLEVRA